ncbi:MAG: outer membrane lipoprotein carrier protein LolA [Burkholderiaceae bacterium]
MNPVYLMIWALTVSIGLIATVCADAQAQSAAPATTKPESAAQPGGPATAVSQLRKFVLVTKAATGRFSQQMDGGKPADASQGRFAFARPGRFRWEVTDPYPQLLVADGQDVYFHDPDLNQVTVRPMAGALGATPAAILFGTGELDDSFELTDLGLVDGANWLQATPKVREAGFEQIRIGFQDNIPVAMEVLDAFNRTTRFVFSDMVRNPILAASEFEFSIPEGADVVRP